MNLLDPTIKTFRSTLLMQLQYLILRMALGLALILLGALPLTAGGDHAGHDHGGHDHGAEKGEHAGHAAGEEEHHDEATLSAEAIQLYGVTIAQAKKEILANLVTVPARVALNGDTMAHIGSPVEGRIAELRVRVGDQVKKGDVLALINSPLLGEAQSEYLQKRTEVEVARTSVQVAEKAYQRGKDLEPGKGITLSEFQKREGELRLAEGNLKGSESVALAARTKLQILGVTQDRIEELLKQGNIVSHLELRAPIDGEVIEREVTLGEIVGPDRETLMVIADLATLWILADVPEKEIARVTVGSPVGLNFGALPGLTFEGRVQYIAPVLDGKTRKGSVRIEVSGKSSIPVQTPPVPEEDHAHAEHGHETAVEQPVSFTPEQIVEFKAKQDWCAEHAVPESKCVQCNPGLAAPPKPTVIQPAEPVLTADVLRAGMFGEAQLQLAAQPGQQALSLVSVPLTAIQTVEGGPAVFVPVPGEANTFTKRSVEIGKREGRWVPILSGLDAAESYVATGTFILKAELGKAGAAHEH